MSKFGGSLIFVTILGMALILLIFFAPFFLKSTYHASSFKDSSEEILATPISSHVISVIHLETPEALRALYMTACVAGTPSWRESLKKLIETTELNAVVIDIKDYTGVVSIPNDFSKTDVGRGCVVADMHEFIQELHKANIYVIGRIAVFQDPFYTKLFPELAVRKKVMAAFGKTTKDSLL